MDAVNSLGQLGGYIRVAVFPAHVNTDKVTFHANVTIQLFIPDLSQGYKIVDDKIVASNHVMITTIKGSLKEFVESGKSMLDTGNTQDFKYPNSFFGSGLRKYVSPELIESMIARIPTTGDKKKDVYIAQFRVVDNKVEKVDKIQMSNTERAEVADDIMNNITNTTTQTHMNDQTNEAVA